MEKEIGKIWTVSYEDLDKIIEIYHNNNIPDEIYISKTKKPMNLNKKLKRRK